MLVVGILNNSKERQVYSTPFCVCTREDTCEEAWLHVCDDTLHFSASALVSGVQEIGFKIFEKGLEVMVFMKKFLAAAFLQQVGRTWPQIDEVASVCWFHFWRRDRGMRRKPHLTRVCVCPLVAYNVPPIRKRRLSKIFMRLTSRSTVLITIAKIRRTLVNRPIIHHYVPPTRLRQVSQQSNLSVGSSRGCRSLFIIIYTPMMENLWCDFYCHPSA